MNELFIINDYDTGKPMYYYLTDNATKCEKILGDIDMIENKDDHWLFMFERECEKQKIRLAYFETIKSYEY